MYFEGEKEETQANTQKLIDAAVKESEEKIMAKQQLENHRMAAHAEKVATKIKEQDHRLSIVEEKVKQTMEIVERIDFDMIKRSDEACARMDLEIKILEEWKYGLLTKGLSSEFVDDLKRWLAEGKDSMEGVKSSLKGFGENFREIYTKQQSMLDDITSRVDKKSFDREMFRHDAAKTDLGERLSRMNNVVEMVSNRAEAVTVDLQGAKDDVVSVKEDMTTKVSLGEVEALLEAHENRVASTMKINEPELNSLSEQLTALQEMLHSKIEQHHLDRLNTRMTVLGQRLTTKLDREELEDIKTSIGAVGERAKTVESEIGSVKNSVSELDQKTDRAFVENKVSWEEDLVTLTLTLTLIRSFAKI